MQRKIDKKMLTLVACLFFTDAFASDKTQAVVTKKALDKQIAELKPAPKPAPNMDGTACKAAKYGPNQLKKVSRNGENPAAPKSGPRPPATPRPKGLTEPRPPLTPRPESMSSENNVVAGRGNGMFAKAAMQKVDAMNAKSIKKTLNFLNEIGLELTPQQRESLGSAYATKIQKVLKDAPQSKEQLLDALSVSQLQDFEKTLNEYLVHVYNLEKVTQIKFLTKQQAAQIMQSMADSIATAK